MVNYYRFKDENPELFENIYPLDFRNIGDANIISVPPYRDQDGRRLLLYRIGENFFFTQNSNTCLNGKLELRSVEIIHRTKENKF